MPNWCTNNVTLHHEDSAMIARAKDAFIAGNFFAEFVPVPTDLSETVAGHFGDSEEQRALEEQSRRNVENHGYSSWYDFCIDRWGTKWDVGGDDSEITSDEPNELSVCFDSAWCPPIAWYRAIEEMGFNVAAYYYEQGCGFCGLYENGEDAYYDIEGNSEWVEENIPEDINLEFSISENMAEWEAEEDDDDPEGDAAEMDALEEWEAEEDDSEHTEDNE